MGWMGGKYKTSKPMSRIIGRRSCTSLKVPWRSGSSVTERGNSSYQLANCAWIRSTSSGYSGLRLR
ncbi:hypothetical protein D3C72_1969570 [compost metagenome]